MNPREIKMSDNQQMWGMVELAMKYANTSHNFEVLGRAHQSLFLWHELVETDLQAKIGRQLYLENTANQKPAPKRRRVP
jgi:hypothetical protein